MQYLFIILGLSMIILLYYHLIVTWKYREQYQTIFDTVQTSLDRLLDTGEIIMRFHCLPLRNKVISPFERILCSIVFILTFPATIIIEVIITTKDKIERCRKVKETYGGKNESDR